MAVGGLSFWLPFIVVGATQPDNANVVLLNIVPLAGLILLGAISRIYTKAFPKWGWVLAGIYILGPTAMLAPSAFFYGPSSPSMPGDNLWLLLFCLFPPTTLYVALLNGMIFSVLIATYTLGLIALVPSPPPVPPVISKP
jgi:hypothetical protein